MERILECVPNFSEGRDQAVIDRITNAIAAVDGVSLLDVDPGAATNRTVVTMAGTPEAVLDAAVAGAKVAAALIDMSRHHGEHPRFGMMDVCPLVPIAGVTMEEAVVYARTLAKRLADEVGLTIYCYEHAALSEQRRNLALVRAGEYEGLEAKLQDPAWEPDFGPATFQAKTGATAVSARDFLVAYNVNLNTTSSRRANAIAFDVREKGRVKRMPDPVTGEIVRDEAGNPLWTPGTLKAVKGIGWFIEEFGVCQVSMNLNDIGITPVHIAFDEVERAAATRGIRVTGSELVGLIPLRAMLDAGRHYLRKQQRATGVSDAELIKIAVKSLGLDELYPFRPAEKIIEYVLAAKSAGTRLAELSVRGFVEETASESPAPGGGSVAATVGALGAALGTMVANLSAHKRGWDARWEEFSDWSEKGKACHDELLLLIDRDTEAFQAIMACWQMPATTDADKAQKAEAVQAAVHGAILVPLRIMEVALASMEVAEAMAQDGIPASLSDAAVGMLCARTAVLGAGYNVRINVADLTDDAARQDYLTRAAAIAAEAEQREAALRSRVEESLS